MRSLTVHFFEKSDTIFLELHFGQPESIRSWLGLIWP